MVVTMPVVMIVVVVMIVMIMVVVMIVAVMVAVRALWRVIGHGEIILPRIQAHPYFPPVRQNFARNVQKCSKVVQAPHRLAGVGCALTVTLAPPAPIACTITPANLHEPIMYGGVAMCHANANQEKPACMTTPLKASNWALERI